MVRKWPAGHKRAGMPALLGGGELDGDVVEVVFFVELFFFDVEGVIGVGPGGVGAVARLEAMWSKMAA